MCAFSSLFKTIFKISQDRYKWESNTKIIPETATWCKLLLLFCHGSYCSKSMQTTSQMWRNIVHQVSFSCLYSVFMLTVYHDPLYRDSINNKCVFVKNVSLGFCKIKWLLQMRNKPTEAPKKSIYTDQNYKHNTFVFAPIFHEMNSKI